MSHHTYPPIETDIVVIYHANCYDGFGGAWAAWKKFGSSATYLPAKYGQHLPEDIDGREVYVIDFSYTEPLLLELEQRARRLVCIDHHKTAEAWVPKLKEYVFRLDHSGAYLAWQYFFPQEPVPKFVEYISESDIFKMTLPYAEEVIAYLHALPLTFESYENMRREIDDVTLFEQAIEKGKLLMTYRDKVLEVAMESVHTIELAGREIPAVNMCFPISEVSHGLHKVYELYPPIAMSYRLDDGIWKCSLRSDTSVDCSKIAEQFGGGGHPGAAGFAIPYEEGVFPFKIIKGA
ncbi:hypothetical protein A3C89_03035 [Candidatus Kaiserbacteria bacterium RIFCSPHIGHO2_02_FULL_50_50]|uniref:DHHA1 domain-containing protein n=1 Tax=Candidatus Kaiserbacteria bacterium RIFCSPHIGHO2_02_FULL_50_50 TaxID=1798492 RepID=A0A1F6DD12_9BACT|nr:MAG: hypothetical protein A3C89_03035 [Candidatus Kaiserbacteria bacterium RIFCSPHIGHO2_02_FULL_50_50]OGG88432.1 MAG: hypothetical protein A3G62_01680 [Candidatus Kaiserbacteria bacterium RIFCSPLOWO2_12_FULL_50_10]